MFTLNDLLQGNPGQAQCSKDTDQDRQQVFLSAQHDSRQVKKGDLFVAIKGETVDGHHFIPAAIEAGARGILCTVPSEDLPEEVFQILVPDVIKALQGAARVRVARQPETIYIGITGSNGKTSTKDAIALVLSQKAPTLKTYGSYNNELGYPLTLLGLEAEHRYAVLEMGAQWVGELAGLCQNVASPTWSLITNVGSSHLGLFGSQENIAIAKAELVQALTPEGIAFLNYDDANVRAMASKTQARILYYGQGEGADVRASNIFQYPQSGPQEAESSVRSPSSTLQPQEAYQEKPDLSSGFALGYHFTLHFQGEQRAIQLHLPGEHGITIALAAAATGFAAGMNIDEVSKALTLLSTSPGRGQIKPGPNGSTLIDDTYNANRQSIIAIGNTMRAAKLGENGKRWAVIGDIFELGQYAHEEHRLSGAALAKTVERLVAVGEEARFYIEGALAAGMPEEHTYYFSADVNDRRELDAVKRAVADLLKHEVERNDLVLLKGSRGMHMETLLSLL